MNIHALILAGGEGSRLGGVCKAGLRIGGTRLIDRVSARLDGAVRPLLVSVGHDAMPVPTGLYALPDAAGPRAGPMAGLAAGLRHLRTRASGDDILVTLAVDTPFLPADYVARLVAPVAAGTSAASYAVWGEAFYPTNAAWRIAALSGRALPASPRALLDMLGATPVSWPASSPDPFANLNTLADLVALQERARRDAR